MQAVTTIGFDIAKSVFQVHGVDTVGQVLIRRQLKRRQVIAFFPEADGRRVRRDPLCQDPWHKASALAHSIAGTATHQSRRDRACQQAGPHGVGDDGYWRALQLSGLAEGLTRSPRHPA